MASRLEGSGDIFLFLARLSKLIRKPYLDPMIFMLSVLEGPGGLCLILTTLSKLIRKPYLEPMI